ncbi:MAG: flagellar biosynthetic protein FliO [Chloroflexi bacterium]|nr:flagellar biosynthetic protein FliO [Chloroflexota bacterium]
MEKLLAVLRADPRWRWAAAALAVVVGLAVLLLLGGATSDDSFAAAAVQAMTKTAIVLGLLFLTLAVLKRWQVTASRGKQMSVVETLRLSPRQALHIVRVGERTLLIGASDTQISLLTDVEPIDSAEPPAPQNAFADFLAQWQNPASAKATTE